MGGHLLIPRKELAGYLGRTEDDTQTIVDLDHTFPKPVRLGGARGKVYFNRAEVDAWKLQQGYIGSAYTSLGELLSKYGTDITKPLEMTCGVYLLYRSGSLIYIGQSMNVYARVTQHRDKAFDKVMFIPCKREVLDVVESVLITTLRPELNGPPPLRDVQLSDITAITRVA